MKVIALVSFLIVGVSCNYYGAPATVIRVLDTPAPLYQTVRDLPTYGSYGGSLVRSTVPLIPITRYSQQIRGGVSDLTDFESGNGIRVSESTQVVAGRGGSYEGENGQMIRSESSLVKSGTYSYSAPDGTPISVSWTADENGFKAAGAHFPVPPPVPAEIAASLRAVNVPY